MADAGAQADSTLEKGASRVEAGEEGASAPRTFELRGRRDLWQIPVTLGAMVMLLVGVWMWIGSAEGPDFAGALDSVERLIDRQEYDAAIATLNGPLREEIGEGAVAPQAMGRFYALRADALYLAQRREAIDVAANHLRIAENYDAARAQTGEALSPERTCRLADTFVSLDRIDDALDQIARIGDAAPELRHDLFKRIIDKGLRANAPAARRGLATDLLARLRGDPDISDDTRIWAVIRQTRLSLASGNPEDAVRRLLPELQRLESRLAPPAGQLFALLGRAYLDLGLLDEARSHLEHASAVVEEGSTTAARVQTLLAHLDRQIQEIERARDRFALVVERFPQLDISAGAWLGLGEVEADLGAHDRSLEAYARLVDAIDSGEDTNVTPEQADQSMEQRYRERYERGDYETALRYADLIHDVYRATSAPPSAVLRLAEIHRRLATSLLEPLDRNPDGTVDVDAADPAAFEQARRHFTRAGSLYQTHARMSLLGDPERSAESLWLAADSMDNAGDLGSAAQLFSEYVEVRHDDPRRVEGEFRLAKTFHARGDYETAAKVYEALLAEHPTAEEAYRSYVPLAQCYLYNPGAEDPDRADELLTRVISGEIFEPDAPEFRAGLIELGALHMRTGRYADAIRRLTEARDRYDDLSDDARFLSRLAEAYRLSAQAIANDLRDAMPHSQRTRLRGLREQHLLAALDLYERVIQRYQSREAAGDRIADLDRTIRRNAMFYRGDCAYDLGEHAADSADRAGAYFERAIRYYDTSAQRYADDPASLVAMIQIVNCYAALGKWREVQTAHERARARLAELPPRAWDATDSPMDRRYWERWLEASVELDRLGRPTEG